MTKIVNYWTEFGIPNTFEPHCTHKYFGPKDSFDVDRIVSTITDYFACEYVKAFTVPFLDDTMFGDQSDIPVSTAHVAHIHRFLPNLRRLLDFFAYDKYPYIPHVSKNFRGLIQFTHYRLRSSEGTVYEHEFIKS